MDNVTTVGIDLAKNVFSLHGVDDDGQAGAAAHAWRAATARGAGGGGCRRCLIGDGGLLGRARVGAAVSRQFGHTVRLMAPQVRGAVPQERARTTATTPRRSARRCSARTCASCRSRRVEQQCAADAAPGAPGLRRASAPRRSTASAACSAEFGIVLPLRAVEVRRAGAGDARAAAGAGADAAPSGTCSSTSARCSRSGSTSTTASSSTLARARTSRAQRLMQLERRRADDGARPSVATVGDAREFANGRQFAAWLGLVPRQYSHRRQAAARVASPSAAMRTCARLLVMGARSVLQMRADSEAIA